MNFAFDYSVFLVCACLIYPPLFWQLYSHMLRQRQKKLAPVAPASRGSKKKNT